MTCYKRAGMLACILYELVSLITALAQVHQLFDAPAVVGNTFVRDEGMDMGV